MKRVKGIGKGKLEAYGKELLEIIQSSGADNKLKNEEQKTLKAKKEKKEKIPTADITYRMYKSGMRIEDIAKERDLVASTIEGHLADKIKEGLLDIFDFIENEKINKIKKYFSHAESYKLTDAREALGEEYTFAELKYVLKYFERNEDKQE